MTAAYIGLIVVGLGLIVWGLPAAHRFRRPWDAVAALAVLAGLCAAIFGALMTTVPGFLKG